MNVSLPSGWDSMKLKHIRAFGSDFDLEVFRTDKCPLKVRLTVHRSSGDEVRVLTPKGGKIDIRI